MLDRLAAAWSTYWTRPQLIFNFVVLVFLSLVSIATVGDRSSFRADSPGPASIGMLAPFVLAFLFPNFVFGQLLRQFQSPFARLLPHYTRPHLIVAGLLLNLAWCVAALVMLSASAPWPLNVVVPSTFVNGAFASCMAAFPGPAGKWLRRFLLIVGGLTLLVLISVLMAPAVGPSRVADAIQPWHAGLSLIQFGFLAIITARCLPQSSRYFAEDRSQSPPMGGAGLGMSSEARQMENSRQVGPGFLWASSLRESDLAGYHGQHWLRRLRLWQAGGSPGPAWLFVIGVLIQLVFTIISGVRGDHETIQVGFVIMQMGIMIPITVLLTALHRQPRFAMELLRPVSRQTAVGDLLRGLAFDLLAIPLFALWAAIWVTCVERIAWTGQHWLGLLAAAAGAYLFSLGVVAILTAVRTTLAMVPFAILLFIPSIPSMWFFDPPPWNLSQSSSLQASAIIGLSLAVPGVAMIAIARRKWLDRELA